MKQSKKISNATKNKDRVLFFDILKIVFIAIIVYDHSRCAVFPWFNNTFFPNGQNFFNIYINGITGLAVYGLIFVSGAVLEYNYQRIERFNEYCKFLFKRFIRLYPAFWMSLLLGIISFPVLLQFGLINIIFEFSGFFVVLGEGPGYINPIGWFIAAIFSLYILFPYLSKMVKKYQLIAMLAFLLVSFVARSLFYIYSGIVPDLLWRWFPICNLFEFCLGIYIIQNKFYPKNQNEHPFIRQLAELSFYVFLFHIIIITAISPFFPLSSSYIQEFLSYCGIMSVVLFVCWIVMRIDNKFQRKIRQNEKVKKFLQY